MTKDELRDYCYSIGLIDTKNPSWAESKYTKGYRFPNEFVNSMDFIAGWDEDKQCVVVAKSCVINEAFVYEGPIRMDGAEAVYNDEEIKARIDDLITSVQENIKFLKWKQMKKKIKKMEGDFE
jgi:hypothetical protein